MASSDAIVIGSDWISEHYFSTEAASQSFHARVLERRKEWDAAAKDAAAQEPPAAADTELTRFQGARLALLEGMSLLGSADDAADVLPDPQGEAQELHTLLRYVLRYGGVGTAVEQDGPLTRVHAPGLAEGAPLVLLDAAPVAAGDVLLAKDLPTLRTPYVVDETTQIPSVARLLSTLFVADDGPQFALVLAGRFALLAERERWAEGRSLTFDLQLICERNETKRGGEVDRLLTCLSARSLAPGADGEIWWTEVLEESVKHTVGVSQDLREGVRLSIELIAREVVARRAAQELPALPQEEAQTLAVQALRFLYRILFLLYAEASPELGVLPTGAREYEQGYSLDRLRELVLVKLTSPASQSGTHLYQSLGVLFHQVDTGHDPTATATPTAGSSGAGDVAEGLTFRSLKADLFRAEATAHIDAVGLGNETLQQVLQHLLLSKASKGRDRGFISYAELGINQLGAVYEGLMSYTGFFAQEDLFEVARGGDPAKGSWVVPVDRAEGLSRDDFVTELDERTGERRPVVHPRGTFVFRLAGRERQQSASYYTPEVLTRFVVSQALAELLDQDGTTTPAADLLTLTVCEPALGSGAFAIEAVRQLAEQYLTRRQKELGRRIDPDVYPAELQRVKASIALHQVHGVDLNATAVELAEISLWLDTMVAGLEAPWFGLHLRRGNSLVGARRAVFRKSQLSKGDWLDGTSTDVPLTSLVEDVAEGRLAGGVAGSVHHFLLPAFGWGSAADAKEAKALAEEAQKDLKAWRRSVRRRPTTAQTTKLLDLAHRVEALWQIAYHRLQIAETEIRRDIPLWGADPQPVGGAVQRAEIEEVLNDPDGAYQRLRRVMDAWCALWFWPLTETEVTPPTLEQWLDALDQLLGRHEGKRKAPQESFLAGMSWEELGTREQLDWTFAGAKPVATVLAAHPWLGVCERVARQQGFFHWELDFAPVFARGGFDLQVGNPPWVRPRSDVDALLAEGDPWWQLAVKPSETLRAAKRTETLQLDGMRELVVDGTADVAVLAAYLGDAQQYPHLVGLQPDLYRCFMERMWGLGSPTGVQTMIHLESHFTDEKAGLFRSELYLRLRRHWHFVNELRLFEIEDHKHWGITVHGPRQEAPSFVQASWLYHPDTVERSFKHDGFGEEPGLKDPQGRWDQRPHAARLVHVDDEVLATWREVLEDESVLPRRTRALFSVNASAASVMDKLARSPRVGALDLRFSRGWDESIDRKKGRFETSWGEPHSWRDVILQGPHLFVSTPFYKSPNKTMKHNQDWSETDFEALAADAIPVTAYKPAGDRRAYDAYYTHWGEEGRSIPARDHYRVAWRRMLANTGERTLISALIPPGAAHVHPVTSLGVADGSARTLLLLQGFLGSLLSDFSVRVSPKSEALPSTLRRLALADVEPWADLIVERSARLNCVTEEYEKLFREGVGASWTVDTPHRRAQERRRAALEIDVLVALSLDISIDELCSVYRTQFPVLYGYDRKDNHYDANGRLVPTSVLSVWRKKGDRIGVAERTATNQAGNTYTYELPFRTLDREADMRAAHAHFSQLFQERS